MGRPSSYTQEIADRICLGLMEGRSLRSVCLDDDMPSFQTVFNWLNGNKAFFEQYARARDVQAEVWADEITDIADDGSNDYMTIMVDGREKEVVDHENIQRSRLRVDTRKWLLSKVLPKKYGDKIAVTGGDGGPVTFQVSKIGDNSSVNNREQSKPQNIA